MVRIYRAVCRIKSTWSNEMTREQSRRGEKICGTLTSEEPQAPMHSLGDFHQTLFARAHIEQTGSLACCYVITMRQGNVATQRSSSSANQKQSTLRSPCGDDNNNLLIAVEPLLLRVSPTGLTSALPLQRRPFFQADLQTFSHDKMPSTSAEPDGDHLLAPPSRLTAAEHKLNSNNHSGSESAKDECGS